MKLKHGLEQIHAEREKYATLKGKLDIIE